MSTLRLRQLGTQHQRLSWRTSRQLAQCLASLLRPWMSTWSLRQRCTQHLHQLLYVALAQFVGAAPVPVVEDIAPAASYVTPAAVDEYMAPVFAVSAAPAPVVDYISPAPVGYAAPAPVGEFISPAPVGYSALAPVGVYMAPANETAVMKITGSGHRRTRPFAIVRILSRCCVQVCDLPETLSCKRGPRRARVACNGARAVAVDRILNHRLSSCG